MKSVYTAEDIQGCEWLDSTSGRPPFVRGNMPDSNPHLSWTTFKSPSLSTAAELNAFYAEAVSAGARDLCLKIDLATHGGYDSDHALAAGKVGHGGVALDTVEDMKILFKQIPLDRCSIFLPLNGPLLPILAFYIVAAEEQGLKPAQLTCVLLNDLLEGYPARKACLYPASATPRILSDIIGYSSQFMTGCSTFSISGYLVSEADCSSTLQLALILAQGLEYTKAAVAGNVGIDNFAPRLEFLFRIGSGFFEDIAMLRAARFLWQRMINPFEPSLLQSSMLKARCQTSVQQTRNNEDVHGIVRLTLECLVAYFGEARCLQMQVDDSCPGQAAEFLSHHARIIDHMLAKESRIGQVVDAFGGSYCVEALTARMIWEAGKIMDEIEQAGGLAKAAETGKLKRLLEASGRAEASAADGLRHKDAGRPAGKLQLPEDVSPYVASGAIRDEQIARLEETKWKRYSPTVNLALDTLAASAESGGNMLEACLPAARARATLGEISATLQRVFGEVADTSC